MIEPPNTLNEVILHEITYGGLLSTLPERLTQAVKDFLSDRLRRLNINEELITQIFTETVAK